MYVLEETQIQNIRGEYLYEKKNHIGIAEFSAAADVIG